MRPLAIQELARADRDRKLLVSIRERQKGKPAVATPHLAGSLDDLSSLVGMARHLLEGGEIHG